MPQQLKSWKAVNTGMQQASGSLNTGQWRADKALTHANGRMPHSRKRCRQTSICLIRPSHVPFVLFLRCFGTASWGNSPELHETEVCKDGTHMNFRIIEERKYLRGAGPFKLQCWNAGGFAVPKRILRHSFATLRTNDRTLLNLTSCNQVST